MVGQLKTLSTLFALIHLKEMLMSNRFKELRKVAEQFTKGFVATSYVTNPSTGQVTLNRGCTRAVYQRLKKAA